MPNGYKEAWERKSALIEQFIREPKFINTEIFISPGPAFLRTNNFIQQTLARILGWNADNEEWRALRLTADGRLYVTTETQKVSTGTVTQVSVDTSAVQLIASNSDRKSIIIKNIGTTNIYIGFDSSVSTTTGFLLSPGESIADDLYIGEWYGIGDASGGKVAIIEL